MYSSISFTQSFYHAQDTMRTLIEQLTVRQQKVEERVTHRDHSNANNA